jgi:ABC-type Na+ efflux pump permease subunit
MPSAAILRRELLIVARRGGTYRRRCFFAGMLLAALLLVWGAAYWWKLWKLRALSIPEMAKLSEVVFHAVAIVQVLLSLWLVPACVAAAIAGEKEQRTLTSVLTTRLSSAEIVLGKLAAGLVLYATCVAATLPIVILLPMLGGVDPRWVVLLEVATAATAFFVAALSILVSTAARRAGRAVGGTVGLVSIWCALPVLVHLMMPRTLPWLFPWVYPVNEWVLASTPTGVLLAALGGGPGWKFFQSVFWMIGLQLAAGSLLMAWAIARFRAACRNQDGEEQGGGIVSRSLGWLPRGIRPPCGDNAVLWKELHTARPRGFANVVGVVIALGLGVLIGYGTLNFARPAILEWFEHGLGPATSDIQRTRFNGFLRIITFWVEFFALLIAAGVAAEGVSVERARDTWDGLVATPLDGRDIMGAKMIGAAWRVRWGPIGLGMLWSVGLLTGSLHPLGLVAALILLGTATWFMVALGTFMSLVSRDTAQASNRTLIPVLLLSFSFLVVYLPAFPATILMAAASAPLLNCLSLLSYRDIAEIATGRGTYSVLADMSISTGEGALRVLATVMLGTAGTAAAAAGLTWAAVARFDRAVGRPAREPEERSAPARPAHGVPMPCPSIEG